ncbi:MAG: hypothetical protein QM811_04615 [Pirellulales bacterium]
MLKSRTAIAIALACLFVGAAEASAQFPCGGFGGFGYGGNYAYATSRADLPPFYAMYPPVYYSQPVARTYGYSPFAYPPGTMTPEIVQEIPQTIVNPHVKESSAPKVNNTTADRTVMAPTPDRVQTTLNPFVTTIQERVTAR